MAKNLVPQYVASALVADRTAQINTLGTLAVYLFGEHKAGREVDALSVTLHKQAPHRSEKTWQNYVSTAQAVATSAHCTVKMDGLHAEAKEPGAMVAPFVQWLESQLKAKKYHTSPEDVANWAKGRLSIKAQEAKKEEEEKAATVLRDKMAAEAAAEALKNAPTQAQKDAQAADAAQAAADEAARIASIAAEKQAQSDATPAGDASAPLEPAIKAPIDTLLVVRSENGALSIEFGPSLTHDDIRQIIESLQAELPEDSTLPIIDPAMIPATV